MPLSKTRWAATPDTPTFDEAGVPGLHASLARAVGAQGHAQGRHRRPSCRAPMRSKQGNTPRILASRAYHFTCAREHWKRRLIVGQYQPLDKNPAAMKSATLVSETR
jgi:hypothetical protein